MDVIVIIWDESETGLEIKRDKKRGENCVISISLYKLWKQFIICLNPCLFSSKEKDEQTIFDHYHDF